MTSRTFRKTLLCAAIAAAFSSTAFAADIAQWTGSSDEDWGNSANWDSPPSSGADVLVTDIGLTGNSITNVIYTNPDNLNPGSFDNPLNSVLVDGASSSNMTLNQATDNLYTDTLTIGRNGTGTDIDPNTLGTGTYIMTGGTLHVLHNDIDTSTFTLGVNDGSVGTFTQSGGDVSVNHNITLGLNPGATAIYNLNNGTGTNPTLNVNGFITFYQGTGTFDQGAGTTVTVGSDIYMSNAGTYKQAGTLTVQGSQGLVVSMGGSTFNNLAGGQTEVTQGNLLVGGSGNGFFTQTGGTVQVDLGNTIVGAGNGRSDEPGNPGIEGNPSGIGDIQQSGGTHTTNHLILGQAGVFGAGTGTYTLSDDGDPTHSTLTSMTTVVGDGSDLFGGTGTFKQQGGTHTTGQLSVGSGIIGSDSAGNGTYNLSGGILNVTVAGGAGLTSVGGGATAKFDQSGGEHNTDNLVLGSAADSAGAYKLDGGTVSVAGDTIIGQAGTGTFTQNAGKFDANGGFYVGGHGANSDSGVGTYSLNAGTLNTGWQVVGEAGIGTFNQTGGTNNASSLLLGNCGGCGVFPVNNSSGYYNLSGGDLNVSGGVSVSGFGYGEFNQTGGTATIGTTDSPADLVIGTNEAVGGTPPREGHYNLSAGLLDVKGSTIVGAGDNYNNPGILGPVGVFQQTGGTHQVGGSLIVGQAGTINAPPPPDPTTTGLGGQGSYSLSNGSLTVTGNTVLGDGSGDFAGTGTFTQTGGTHTTADLILAAGTGSSGTYTLSGSGSELHANNIVVGQEGAGQFTQSNGLVTANTLKVGGNWDENPFALGVGQYSLSGGTITVGGGTSVGETSQGAVLQTGGTFNAGYLSVGTSGLWSSPNPAFPSGYQPNSNGDFKLQGGILNTNGATVASSGMGSFTQNDISSASQHNVSGDLVIGAGPAGVETNTGLARQGSYSLAGGVLTSTLKVSGNSYLGVGNSNSPDWIGEPGGLGTFTQTGGTHAIGTYDQDGNLIGGGTLIIGQAGSVAGGTGTYNLSDDGNPAHALLTTAVTSVGDGGAADGGTGTFNQSGGTHTTDQLFVGAGSGKGTYNLSGTGVLNVTGPNGGAYIGEGSTAQFTQKGSSQFTTHYLSVGSNGGSNAQYDLSGGTVTVSSNMSVGGNGNGTFTHTSGSVDVGGTLVVNGKSDGSTSGQYTLSGINSTLTTKGLEVGAQGIGKFDQSGGTVNVNNAFTLYIGHSAGSSGTYTLSDGELNVTTNEEKIGGDGTGHFNQTGGTHNFQNTAMYLGDWQGSYGEYKLSGGAVNGGSIALGEWGGQGKFIQSGGSVTVNELSLARQNFPVLSQGDYQLSGGSLKVNGNEFVGINGIGSFDQSGGTNTVTGTLSLGEFLGGSGTYQLSDTGKLSVSGLINDGNQGTGHITQGAGTTVEAAAVTLGMESSGNGDYQLAGGTLHTTTGYLVVGDQGKGTFGQTGGGVTVDNVLVLGQSATGNGKYTLDNGTVQVGNVIVGDSGVGQFKQNGGTVEAGWMDVGSKANATASDYLQSSGSNTVTNSLVVGRDTGANGTYELQNDASLMAGEVVVGAFGTGVFTQSGASSQNQVNTVALGYNIGSSGTYNLVDGSLISDWDRIGMEGKGVFTQSGGSHTVNTTVVVGQDAESDGTYNLQVGQLSAGFETIGRYNGSTGLFDQTGGTNTVTNDLNVGGQGSFPITPGTGSTGKGTYNLTGGSLSVGGTTYVGVQGTGIFNQQDTTFTTGSLVLGSQSGSSGTYTLTDPILFTTYLHVTGNEVVGDAGVGTFIQHAGEHTVGGDLSIANNTSANGSSFSLDNTKGASTLDVLGTLFVGNGGNGSFDLNSGGVASYNTFIGNGGDGAFTQTGGSNTVYGTPGGTGNLFVGYTSNGTYSQSGGTTIAPAVGVGVVAGSHGIYNLSGGSLTGGLALGYGGQGDFHQSDAAGASTVAVNNSLHLGELTGSTGSYTLDGANSSLAVTGANKNEIIGVGGTGTFTQNAGTHTVEGVLSLGGQNGTLGMGTYNLNGGSLTVGTSTTPGWAFIGENGTGVLIQSNSASATVNGNLVIGREVGSHGTYTLVGGSMDVLGTGLTGGNLAVGHQGLGSFTQSGGQVTTNELQVAGGPVNGSTTAQGSYNLASGTLTANVERIGNTGVGTFSQFGGSNIVAGNVNVAEQAGSFGTYSLSGGSLTAANLNVNTGGTFNYSGGSLALASGAGIWDNDGQANIHAATSGGSLTVNASVVNDGTFKVTDTNVTYTGTFTNNGLYISDPSTSHFSDLIVNNPGNLLGGAGDRFVVGGNFDNNSTNIGGLWDTHLATLDFTGIGTHIADFGSGSAFQWGSLVLELGVNLNRLSDLYVTTLDLAGGYNQLIALLQGGSSLINVGSFILGGTATSYNEVISYLDVNGYHSLTGDLVYLNSVPEPGSLFLMGAGFGGMLFGARRRKA